MRQIRGNLNEHSFVNSSLECRSHDGASAPRNPGEGRTSLKGKGKTRTPPAGTLRERWKIWEWRYRLRNHERGTVNRKSLNFLNEKSNGKKSNWAKWNKNMELEELERNGTRPRTGHCRERELDWRMSTAGSKCIFGRWSGGNKFGSETELVLLLRKFGKIVMWGRNEVEFGKIVNSGGMKYGTRERMAWEDRIKTICMWESGKESGNWKNWKDGNLEKED